LNVKKPKWKSFYQIKTVDTKIDNFDGLNRCQY
jgi:hypothetical protein